MMATMGPKHMLGTVRDQLIIIIIVQSLVKRVNTNTKMHGEQNVKVIWKLY
jgi:hypothetical protein